MLRKCTIKNLYFYNVQQAAGCLFSAHTFKTKRPSWAGAAVVVDTMSPDCYTKGASNHYTLHDQAWPKPLGLLILYGDFLADETGPLTHL